MSFLTTGVSQTGLSRAGRCGPCVRWASSTAYLQRWPAATPYTPALLSIASVHPGKTGCSPLCDPSLGLEGGREGAEWKINSISSGLFFVPEDHYCQILVFKSNPCLLGFISNIKNALKNLKTQYRNQDMNFTNNIWSYAAGNAFGWMDTNLANLKIISFSKLGRLMMRFVHS